MGITKNESFENNPNWLLTSSNNHKTLKVHKGASVIFPLGQRNERGLLITP